MSSESSAYVQREAEAERADLVRTLDQLRENLKPANVVDEVMATAKVTTSDISDRIWQTARDNPIPAAFIALGAAMLAGFGKRVQSTANSTTEASEARQPRGSFRWDTEPRTTAAQVAGAEISERLHEADERAAVSASKIARSARSLRRQASRATGKRPPSTRKTPDRS